MILLGLLLMCACIAMAVDAVAQNGHVTHATAFNQPIDHLTLGGLFIAGAVVGIVFALGVLMFTGGIGRSRRRRVERRNAVRESTAEAEALRAHNERLERELEDQRDTGATDATAYPAETTGTADGQNLNGDRRTLSGRHRAR
ncbi:MAG: hypothetical protein QOD07_1474 [Frankiaceae bacterium]|jgi:hypothetical protein|nr:hypothetical protein [Frankiaceae bacterium]